MYSGRSSKPLSVSGSENDGSNPFIPAKLKGKNMDSKISFDIELFREKVNNLCENGVDFMDAILTIVDNEKLEIESLVPILKKDSEFKSRLFLSAEKLNFFKKD